MKMKENDSKKTIIYDLMVKLCRWGISFSNTIISQTLQVVILRDGDELQ
jgi:hypothetical protein